VLTENGNVVIAAGLQTLIISPAGAIVWKWGSPCWIDETPAVAQGTICFSTPWRQFFARQPDGTALWDGQLLDNLTSSPVIGNHGEFYFSCSRHMGALRPPVAMLPAKSPWPMFRANARHPGRVGGK